MSAHRRQQTGPLSGHANLPAQVDATQGYRLLPSTVKISTSSNAIARGGQAHAAGLGGRNHCYPDSPQAPKRYAHGMRNAGDRAPGGSGGRRGRPRAPEQASPAETAGGASLFTPAYRVSNSRTGTRPAGDAPAPAAGPSGYGGADLPGAGYSRPDSEPDQARTGHRPPGYDYESGPGWDNDPLAVQYGWADDAHAETWPGSAAAVRETAVQPRGNAVRGFPPAPGEPLPVYPPGPFAAWNRGRGGRAGEGAGSAAGGYSGSSGQLATATITPDEFDTDYSLPAIKDPVPGQAGGAKQRTAAHSRRHSAGGGAVTEQPRAPRRGGRASGKERAARTRRRRLSASLAITAAAVIVAAVALILVLSNPGPGTPAANRNRGNSPRPAATSPSVPSGKWKYIASRATDPVPLTLVELYPAVITNGAKTYRRATADNGKNCHGSTIGSALQAAVKRGGCTQVLRATYLSRSSRVMATIGVFNLKTAALASKAARKAGRSEFVAQLPAKTGPTQAIGQGTGLEEALVKGHYLVLIWAEATNLSAPNTTAARAHISNFMSLLINRTVNVSLSTRMVNGRPPRRH
jgi:hypothetical protein